MKYKPLYRYFCGDEEWYDFSNEAAYEAFIYESQGKGNFKLGVCNENKKWNGYIVGKHWMDVTIKMWREDIKNKLLFLHELYNDPELKPFHWWLDNQFKNET